MRRDRERKNAALAAADKRYVWHPFTQMRDWEADEPLVIERGKGCYLYDVLGRKYLDGVSSLWVTVHGHRKKEIDEAVIRQVRTLSHSTFLGLTHPGAVELARRLVEVAPPGLERVFYSDNGSTAVEIGLKMAFQYWRQKGEPGRTKFLCLKGAYHGDTIGSVSVGGMELFHDIFRPLLFETVKAPAPYCYRCELGLSCADCKMKCLDALE
ncbi:MAG TPA: aminotransferase class III-fold pyridoxal phosphate-dependent enzyme, partial [Nitrospirota bacterium]|nr:aminotransferase class III-fold pyridoxal phosphate-dependent enzyme [Nitrospirota bacterium]